MATYVIGDIQGCNHLLQKLLKKISFSPETDKLWFVGDLINRGPHSLDVLRFVKSLGKSAITVLGNHDLHLLAVAYGYRKRHRNDTFDAILNAPDKDALLYWLRHRPLMYYAPKKDIALIHAGISPFWDIKQAKSLAMEVESVLQSKQHTSFYANMYGDKPDLWDVHLKGWDRLRYISNSFTRLRFCDKNGRLMLNEKGPPHMTSPKYTPWFEQRKRNQETLILFGHWSTLGLVQQNNVIGLDTGCLWGGELTAYELKSKQFISVDCPAEHDIQGDWG